MILLDSLAQALGQVCHRKAKHYMWAFIINIKVCSYINVKRICCFLMVFLFCWLLKALSSPSWPYHSLVHSALPVLDLHWARQSCILYTWAHTAECMILRKNFWPVKNTMLTSIVFWLFWCFCFFFCFLLYSWIINYFVQSGKVMWEKSRWQKVCWNLTLLRAFMTPQWKAAEHESGR